MGQVLHKPKPGAQNGMQQKQELEIKQMIDTYLNENFSNIAKTIDCSGAFYQAIYEAIEKLSEMKGAMHFRMPSIETLQREVIVVQGKRKPKSTNYPLTKEELKEVILRVFSIDKFHIGQASRDIFLYIFGIPIVGLLGKRMLPGPTASIPDDIFIPTITSATVIALAKTNRL